MTKAKSQKTRVERFGLERDVEEELLGLIDAISRQDMETPTDL